MFSRHKVILILLTLVIVALVLFLLSRTKSPDEDKFVEVYIQLSIAQMKFQDNPERSAAERKKIFSEYKYSQKELDRFIKSYEKHPEKWGQIVAFIPEKTVPLLINGVRVQALAGIEMHVPKAFKDIYDRSGRASREPVGAHLQQMGYDATVALGAGALEPE